MEKRVALISILVEDLNSAEELNGLLHRFSDYILGRMGIPYRERGIQLISVAMDAPTDTVNSLCGKIGRLNGVQAKAIYSAK